MGQSPVNFLTKIEKQRLLSAIADAEDQTSGEIRVHIERHCKVDVLDRAAYMFSKLGMTQTRDRNGVLFYIAVDSHKLAILGDAGINAHVPEKFWEELKTNMIADFKEGCYIAGLEKAIKATGYELKKHFPWQRTDINELPDQISEG
ncbi:MAG TPA: hypothetical protein DCM62_06545 [Bacteroidales bacterium]|nr:hypothetical protein [Bacteroidales bacterium]